MTSPQSNLDQIRKEIQELRVVPSDRDRAENLEKWREDHAYNDALNAVLRLPGLNPAVTVEASKNNNILNTPGDFGATSKRPEHTTETHPTPSPQDHIERLLAEFEQKVNDVRRDTHWGDDLYGPAHEFGLKTQRFGADGTELFTILDWENIKKFISSSLHSLAETQKEKADEVIRLILPLAKGYAAHHPVGSNQRYVEIAEEYLNSPEA